MAGEIIGFRKKDGSIEYVDYQEHDFTVTTYAEDVDKSGGSGIIELNRNKNYTHRYTTEDGKQIIDKATYNKLTKPFVRNGGKIIRGEEAEKHLGKAHSASYLPSLNSAFIRDDATVSDVLEEMYHAEQDRKNMFGNKLTDEVYLRREINAQHYLLSLTEKYNIPSAEVEETRRNLKYYEDKLKEFLNQKRGDK